MKAELYKRLFKAIYTEDIVSLKKLPLQLFKRNENLVIMYWRIH